MFVARRENVVVDSKKDIVVSLMYLGKISIEIKKRLRNAFRLYCPDINLKIVFSSTNRLKNGFSFKDVIMKNLNSLVLYKYTCGICKETYIGQTKRHFIVRTHEHLGISILTNNNYSYNENTATAVRKHIHDSNHLSSIDDFQIIGSSRNNYHLRIKESILISMWKPTLNIAKESMPLHLY